jgi:putative FmdB family regulatory protein
MLPTFDESSKDFLNMPIYEYQCEGCEYEFESLQRMSEPSLTQCPSCGKDLLKKKISAVAFRLKGGGWYETDFKSGDKKNVASSSDSGGESASSESKSESKSETKSSDGATSSKTDNSTKSSEPAEKSPKKGAKNGSPKSAPKNESKSKGGSDKSSKT